MASAPSDSFSGPSSSSPQPDLATRASEAVGAVKDRARALAGDEIVDQASEAVLELKDQVSGQAYDLADDQIRRGAAGIDSVAKAVHGAARDFEKSLPQAAGLIHQAAVQLERASTVVRDSSVEDIVTLVGDFARRQPAAFFAGSVLAGFVFTRFLKSSAGYRAASSDAGFPPRRTSDQGV